MLVSLGSCTSLTLNVNLPIYLVLKKNYIEIQMRYYCVLTNSNAKKDCHCFVCSIGGAKRGGCHSHGAHHQADVVH